MSVKNRYMSIDELKLFLKTRAPLNKDFLTSF